MGHTMGGSQPTSHHREVANKLIILLVLCWDNYYHGKTVPGLPDSAVPCFCSFLLARFFFFFKSDYQRNETLWLSLEPSGLCNKEVPCSLLRQVAPAIMLFGLYGISLSHSSQGIEYTSPRLQCSSCQTGN